MRKVNFKSTALIFNTFEDSNFPPVVIFNDATCQGKSQAPTSFFCGETRIEYFIKISFGNTFAAITDVQKDSPVLKKHRHRLSRNSLDRPKDVRVRKEWNELEGLELMPARVHSLADADESLITVSMLLDELSAVVLRASVSAQMRLEAHESQLVAKEVQLKDVKRINRQIQRQLKEERASRLRLSDEHMTLQHKYQALLGDTEQLRTKYEAQSCKYDALVVKSVTMLQRFESEQAKRTRSEDVLQPFMHVHDASNESAREYQRCVA